MDELTKVYEWLRQHAEEMEQQLLSLLSIPSVQGEAAPGAPFGPGPAQALRFCLELARRQGFAASDMDGYIGMIDLPGQSAEQVGVLSHVDVVTARAADWRFPPFAPRIVEGQIWGRGAIDDKGPLIACQYALTALRECGCQLRRSVRHLLGTNEETGMACVEYYIQHSPQLPVCGFAPDAVFPVVCGEKGLLRWSCRAAWSPDITDAAALRLLSLSGGSGINSVPAAAEASLTADEAGWRALQAAMTQLPADWQRTISFSRQDGRLLLQASGLAAHAAFPQRGDNAVLKLLGLLARVELQPVGAGEFIRQLFRRLADTSGQGLGIAQADQYSSLSNLLSLIDIGPAGGEFSCDTRYTVSGDGDALQARLQALAAELGWEYSHLLSMVPLFYPQQHPLIATLLEVYRQHCGAQQPPQVIGTGSYARKLDNFVAFGPLFPDQENITHQADERLERDKFHQLARIYASAIYRLANL